MLLKAIGGPASGRVLVDYDPPPATVRYAAQTELEGTGSFRTGVYGLVFVVPHGEGPWNLAYQWKGYERV